MTLGENIVRLRTQRNWSQGDLADALDISRRGRAEGGNSCARGTGSTRLFHAADCARAG